MSPRLAPVLAGVLMLVLPSQVLAQRANCRTIRALTNADGREFADLEISMGAASLGMRAGARAPDLEGPSECELRTEGDRRDIDCRWRFYGAEPAADFYETLLPRMRTCLAAAMPADEIPARTDGWQILRRHQATVTAEYSQTQVELSLVDATRRVPEADGPPTHYVQLTVEFEQGD